MARSKMSAQSKLIQLIEYMVSGSVYFVTGYVAFFTFWSVLHWSLWWAKVLADVVGWVVNYLLQRFWVFANPDLAEHRVQVTRRYAVVTLADFMLDYVIVRGLRAVGITPYIGQFVSAGFFTVWNYIWYRFWVFPESHRLRGRPVRSLIMSAQHVPRRSKDLEGKQ